MRRAAAVALALFSTVHVWAGSGKGSVSAPFLKIPAWGRPAAMGGAFTAVSADASALDYNPAGLTGIYRVDMNATFLKYVQDDSLQSIALAFPLELRSGDSEKMGPDAGKLFMGFGYRQFKAQDEQRNELGVKLGEFDDRDQLINVGLAYTPFDVLTFGFQGKLISSRLSDKSISNYAGDLGLLARLNPRLALGAALTNLGGSKAFISEADPLPLTARAGAAYYLRQAMFTADLSQGRDKIFRQALGTEVSAGQMLKLRAGVIHHTDLQFTAGIGLRISAGGGNPSSPPAPSSSDKPRTLDGLDTSKSSTYRRYADTSPAIDFGFDYALTTESVLGITHTFTLKVLY